MPILKDIGALVKALWVPYETVREYSSASTKTPKGFLILLTTKQSSIFQLKRTWIDDRESVCISIWTTQPHNWRLNIYNMFMRADVINSINVERLRSKSP